MKQEKTYGDSHAPNRSVPLCCPFFSTFFQKTPQDESLKMTMFSTCSADFIPFTFTGKERDEETGYGYFGARYMDHELMTMWLSVDPMANKYPSLSPYAYCVWNPVKLVDPDGNTVRVADKQSRLNIKYSLTKYESRYIKFDKKGNLDVRRLNRCKSNSVNFNALRTLAQSEREYIFSTESFHKDIYNEIDLTNPYRTEGVNNKGVTLMPGNVQDPSPDQNVYVITSSNLTIEDQVSNLAHEGYGHAFFFELSQHNSDVNPNHNYQREIVPTYDEELQRNVPTVIRCDMNTALKQQIDAAVQEAKQNYKSWRE